MKTWSYRVQYNFPITVSAWANCMQNVRRFRLFPELWGAKVLRGCVWHSKINLKFVDGPRRSKTVLKIESIPAAILRRVLKRSDYGKYFSYAFKDSTQKY